MVAARTAREVLQAAACGGVALLLLLSHGSSYAAPLENRIAVFAALDKITGEITTLEVPMDAEATFGTFHIRPRTCHTRPPTEQPRTMAFVEIDEFTYNKKHRRVFTGWMNAESPGLHAVEHPLFDVWLTGCRLPMGSGDGQATARTRTPPDASTAGKEVPLRSLTRNAPAPRSDISPDSGY